MASDDFRANLDSKDVAERAAAVRAVGSRGSYDDLSRLLELAMGDKSPSVRLYAAAAATTLLYRLRADEALPDRAESDVMDTLRAYNPQHNPPLLMVMGAVGTPATRKRLGRLLRDPHSDVRMAAATSVRRLALSARSPDELAGEALSWLQTGKLPPDATADLVRLAGEAGWSSWSDALRQAVAKPALAEAATQALERLRMRGGPEAWQGLWLDGGGDVSDEEAAGSEGWLLVADGAAHDGAASHAVSVDEGGVTVSELGRAQLRWAKPVKGEAEQRVLQVGGRTLWRCEGKALAKVVEARHDELAAFPAGCAALAAELEEVDGAVAPRARALARWRGGDPSGAAEALDALLAAKKPKAELHWYRANVALALGHLDDAREHVDVYLSKAAKKAPARPEAEALQASLTAG
jgi:hypothetical protein